MNFGENLKKLRKRKNISQEELANKVCVSRQSVSKWECGESYPTMENILALCSIFHCKVNDLVYENLGDYNLLDEDVKNKVMKLSLKKQAQMKALSKAIFTISKIFKFFCFISVILLVVSCFVILFVSQNVELYENHSISFYGETIHYEVMDSEIILRDSRGEYKFQDYNEVYPMSLGIQFLENHGLSKLVWFTEILFFVLIITLIFLGKTFQNLENLFVNIYGGETPFTMENVHSIKMMTIYMIFTIVIPSFSGTICEFFFHFDLHTGVDLGDFIYILFLYSMAYIFEYGYEIQLDSRGKLYACEME